MSSKQKHLFLNVVELDEHTGSSYDGQLSSQTQRASNAEKALQIAWYSQVTFVHGSISLGQKKKKKRKEKKRTKGYLSIDNDLTTQFSRATAGFLRHLIWYSMHGIRGCIRVKVRLFMTDKSLQTKNKII